MAQILEENIVIKISRIAKDGNNAPTSIVTKEVLETLESVAQELIGNAAIVEVVTG